MKHTYGVPLQYIEYIVLNTINKKEYLTYFTGTFKKEYKGVKVSDLYSKQREREIVIARQTIMYIIDLNYKLTTTIIGGLYGKDHCTFIYAKACIEKYLGNDKTYIRFYDEIESLYNKNCFITFNVPKHFIKALVVCKKYGGNNAVKELIEKLEEVY